MENSTKEILAIIMWTVMVIMATEVIHIIIRKFNLYLHPPDDLAWPKKYLQRKMKYPHPVYKGVEVTGTCEGILPTKDKGKGGVPRYKLHMNEGSGSFTDIYLDSKWEYADVKNRP